MSCRHALRRTSSKARRRRRGGRVHPPAASRDRCAYKRTSGSTSRHAGATESRGTGRRRRPTRRLRLPARALEQAALPRTRPERINCEIGRRCDVVGILPNDAALIRLSGMLLTDQSNEWLIPKSLSAVLDLAEDTHGRSRRSLPSAGPEGSKSYRRCVATART